MKTVTGRFACATACDSLHVFLNSNTFLIVDHEVPLTEGQPKRVERVVYEVQGRRRPAKVRRSRLATTTTVVSTIVITVIIVPFALLLDWAINSQDQRFIVQYRRELSQVEVEVEVEASCSCPFD